MEPTDPELRSPDHPVFRYATYGYPTNKLFNVGLIKRPTQHVAWMELAESRAL
ncbi:MAG: hypothetical protein ACXW00_02825 [Methylobacter sp.]